MIPPLQSGIPGGPELLIVILLFLLFLILAFGLSYWVYTDSEKHGDDNAAFWALAVGGLMFLTFLGGFLALAVYVWQRG